MGGVRTQPGTRKRRALAPIQIKKTFWKILRVKIDFVKRQGIYLESGLISADVIQKHVIFALSEK